MFFTKVAQTYIDFLATLKTTVLIKTDAATFRLLLKMFEFVKFQNLSIAIVGKGKEFSIFEDEAVGPYLELIAGEAAAAGGGAADEGEDEPPAGMETD